MSLIVKVIVVLLLVNLSISTNHGNEPTSWTALNCPEFFNSRSPWPRTKTNSSDNLVRLCQTQSNATGVFGPFFATLYDVTNRIPVYTANKVKYTPCVTQHSRPENSTYWDRVAFSLCASTLPTQSVASDIKYVEDEILVKCNINQAINADYKNNGMDLSRGHLTPSGINNQDRGKQIATFTLTNVAPQYIPFNSGSWNQYEQLVMDLLEKRVPDEYVYIITGTANTDEDKFMNNNSVRIPGKYWKAVCYPGNSTTSKPAWGYAIIQDNVDLKTTADKRNYITLRAFAARYFIDPPFSQACMNAPIPSVDEFSVFSINLMNTGGVDPKCSGYLVNQSNKLLIFLLCAYSAFS